jgi:hypothetical protein
MLASFALVFGLLCPRARPWANSAVHDNVHDVAVDIDLSIFIGLHYQQLTESKGDAIVRILPEEPF